MLGVSLLLLCSVFQVPGVRGREISTKIDQVEAKLNTVESLLTRTETKLVEIEQNMDTLIQFFNTQERNLAKKMGTKNGKPVLREEDIAALSKSGGLDESQVKDAFNNFVAQHPNGEMTPKDFREMMDKALPTKDDASKMEKHVLRIYDVNNDGYIDFTEFMSILFLMSDGSPEQVLTKIFRVFDVNSDGIITQKEMTKLIKDMYGLLKAEDPNIADKDLVAKFVFTEMDKDHDVKVTTAEFISACMGQEEFSKFLAIEIIDIFVADKAKARKMINII